jgi:hypothetical protein
MFLLWGVSLVARIILPIYPKLSIEMIFRDTKEPPDWSVSTKNLTAKPAQSSFAAATEDRSVVFCAFYPSRFDPRQRLSRAGKFTVPSKVEGVAKIVSLRLSAQLLFGSGVNCVGGNAEFLEADLVRG